MISSYLNILSINLSRLSFQAPICTNFKVATYRKEGSAIFYLLEFMPELFFFISTSIPVMSDPVTHVVLSMYKSKSQGNLISFFPYNKCNKYAI